MCSYCQSHLRQSESGTIIKLKPGKKLCSIFSPFFLFSGCSGMMYFCKRNPINLRWRFLSRSDWGQKKLHCFYCVNQVNYGFIPSLVKTVWNSILSVFLEAPSLPLWESFLLPRTWGPCYHLCSSCIWLLTCFSQEFCASSTSETLTLFPLCLWFKTCFHGHCTANTKYGAPRISGAHISALCRYLINTLHIPHVFKTSPPLLCFFSSPLSLPPLFWCALTSQHHLLSPALFSSKSILAILGPLYSYINFRISL